MSAIAHHDQRNDREERTVRMLFDPDAGKTREQIYETIWRRRPDLQAWFAQLSAVSGRTIHELCEEAEAIACARLTDPARRQAFLDRIARQEQPFGPDPRVREEK